MGRRPHLAAHVLQSQDGGLAYIPVIGLPSVWVDLLHNGCRNSFFTAIGLFPDKTYDAAAFKPYYGPIPDRKKLEVTRKVKPLRELIRTWDPVAKKQSGNTIQRRARADTTAG
jgi:hypothetical protein